MAAVVVAVIVGLVVWSPPALGDVPVSLKDYSIAMSSKLSAGSHTFGSTTTGSKRRVRALPHRPRGRLAPRRRVNGEVIEDSPELETVADSGSDLKPGASRAVRGRLDPGHYVAVCNLPEHYEKGMRLNVTVK